MEPDVKSSTGKSPLAGDTHKQTDTLADDDCVQFDETKLPILATSAFSFQVFESDSLQLSYLGT